MKKTTRKNIKYARNETILEMEHVAKAIDFAKMVKLGQKLKMPKTCGKLFNKNIIVCSVQKNRSKKHQIVEK